MKKLLILLVCLLPLFAQAESLPALESEVPLQFAYAPTQLEEVVLLPGTSPCCTTPTGRPPAPGIAWPPLPPTVMFCGS